MPAGMPIVDLILQATGEGVRMEIRTAAATPAADSAEMKPVRGCFSRLGASVPPPPYFPLPPGLAGGFAVSQPLF